MNGISADQENAVLDAIIGERRTIRKFRNEPVPEDAIISIIHAGLHGPYAGAAVAGSTDYFRRFFVIRNPSITMEKLQPLFLTKVTEMADGLEKVAAADENFREVSTGFRARMAMIRKLGIVPGIGTAPVFLIVAEKKGFPPVEQQSLAHVLENMWLKATALGLGFQLVSATSQMEDVPEFLQALKVENGKWAFMGCAIGYPAETLSPSIRPAPVDVTVWLP